MSKLRVSHIIVHAVLVWDDGEELTPGPEVRAVPLPVSKVTDFLTALPDELAAIEAQALEQPEPETR